MKFSLKIVSLTMNQSKVIGFDKVSYFRCRCGGVGKADIAGLRRAIADFFFCL